MMKAVKVQEWEVKYKSIFNLKEKWLQWVFFVCFYVFLGKQKKNAPLKLKKKKTLENAKPEIKCISRPQSVKPDLLTRY